MYEEIVRASLEELNEAGIKFTMDDLARRLRVSKRTIYETIPSKELLISDIIDMVFEDIKKQENEIAGNPDLDIVDKIRQVVCIMPMNVSPISYNRIYEIKKYYPDLYKKIDDHLSNGWETTLGLFMQGIKEKRIRNVNISIIRQLLLGAFRTLFDDEYLISNKITYEEALKSMIDIIMNGIVEKCV